MKTLAIAIAWIRSLRLVKNDLILGLRAVGAILLANTLVVPILSNGQNHYWWVLLYCVDHEG